jgi:LPXTG-motif cell wall-anchored protein
VEISPAVALRPTLPRTGADVLPLLRLGGLLLLAGGAAFGGRAVLGRRAV